MRDTLRNILATLLAIALVATFSASAHADVSGTISGRIFILDNRAASPNSATLGTLVPARHMVVAVVAANSQTNHINPHSFAVTDDNGSFTLTWSDETRSAFPVPLHVKVTYQSSNGPIAGTTRPPVLFQILRSGAPDTSPEDIFKPTVTAAVVNVGNLNIGAGLADEESAAYLTTREFFERIVARSATLRARMPGLTVKTRVQGFGIFTGLTPFPHEVWVTPGLAVSNPLTVAHEIGHAVTWNALQLNSAPINPLTDYMMNGVPGWSRDGREFSKAAFLEGMADFWSLLWLFNPNDNPVLMSSSKTFRFESGKVFDASGTRVLSCKSVERAWEFPFCHTVALWDLIDSATGDRVDLNIAQIVDTLNRFPNNCIANGCRDELGLDALNHLDFLRNAPAALQPDILGVWRGNGINGGN